MIILEISPQKIEMLRMKWIQTKRLPATVHICEMGCEQRGLLAAAGAAAGADGGKLTDRWAVLVELALKQKTKQQGHRSDVTGTQSEVENI